MKNMMAEMQAAAKKKAARAAAGTERRSSAPPRPGDPPSLASLETGLASVQRRRKTNANRSDAALAAAGLAESTTAQLSAHTIAKLLEWGNPKPAAELYVAARDGDAVAVAQLLDDGTDANVVLHDGGEWRETSLLAAARFGRTAAVRVLLAQGADVDARDGDGSNAAHAAASMDHTETLAALIDKGVDVLHRNSRGATPAHVAAFAGHTTKTAAALFHAGGM